MRIGGVLRQRQQRRLRRRVDGEIRRAAMRIHRQDIDDRGRGAAASGMSRIAACIRKNGARAFTAKSLSHSASAGGREPRRGRSTPRRSPARRSGRSSPGRLAASAAAPARQVRDMDHACGPLTISAAAPRSPSASRSIRTSASRLRPARQGRRRAADPARRAGDDRPPCPPARPSCHHRPDRDVLAQDDPRLDRLRRPAAARRRRWRREAAAPPVRPTSRAFWSITTSTRSSTSHPRELSVRSWITMKGRRPCVAAQLPPRCRRGLRRCSRRRTGRPSAAAAPPSPARDRSLSSPVSTAGRIAQVRRRRAEHAVEAPVPFLVAVEGARADEERDRSRPPARRQRHDLRRGPPGGAVVDADIGRARGRQHVRGDGHDAHARLAQPPDRVARLRRVDGDDAHPVGVGATAAPAPGSARRGRSPPAPPRGRTRRAAASAATSVRLAASSRMKPLSPSGSRNSRCAGRAGIADRPSTGR